MTVESAEAAGALLSPELASDEFELALPANFVVNHTFENPIVSAFAGAAHKPAPTGSHFHSWCEGLLDAFGLVAAARSCSGQAGR